MLPESGIKIGNFAMAMESVFKKIYPGTAVPVL
jgi:hypothetical protein